MLYPFQFHPVIPPPLLYLSLTLCLPGPECVRTLDLLTEDYPVRVPTRTARLRPVTWILVRVSSDGFHLQSCRLICKYNRIPLS